VKSIDCLPQGEMGVGGVPEENVDDSISIARYTSSVAGNRTRKDERINGCEVVSLLEPRS
jgi:hypothetical protein